MDVCYFEDEEEEEELVEGEVKLYVSRGNAGKRSRMQ
jgi:hypothetical protein